MQINLPKIVRPVPLSEYAPELGDVSMWMWVNPPRAFLARNAECTKALREDPGEATLNAWCAWWGEAWSQGPEETSWTTEDVRALLAHCEDTDPALWAFILGQCLRLLAEHRDSARKN